MDVKERAGLEDLLNRLWDIPRSLTGNGVRKSFQILYEHVPYKIHEVPSGKEVFDWKVPLEWNAREAWIVTPTGQRIANFSENNLHLMGYSEPVDKTVTWDELASHLYVDRQNRHFIPYRTSYYQRDWGFSLAAEAYDRLPREGDYHVYIDSTLEDGKLTYGDIVLKGRSCKEIFFSSYICHPRMANNELSGPILQSLIYKYVSSIENRRCTYRFLLAPETIGSIVYLEKYGEHLKSNMRAGFILTCVGLDTHFTYKRSRRGDSYVDRITERVLEKTRRVKSADVDIRPYYPYGSDERQYCSPGFNLPVGSIMRGVPGEYPEYHSSADDKDLLSFDALLDVFQVYKEIIDDIESDRFYCSSILDCEPRLGSRGLYPSIGGSQHGEEIRALNWVTNLSDGDHSVKDIVEFSGLPVDAIERALGLLLEAKLIYLFDK